MKFLLDANIPYSTTKIFHKPDIAIHVRDIGFADAEDEDIVKRAFSEGAILISRDLDFANTVLHPIKTHFGAIVLRVPPHFAAQEIIKVLTQFLSIADKESLAHALTIVEPGRYRIRRG